MKLFIEVRVLRIRDYASTSNCCLRYDDGDVRIAGDNARVRAVVSGGVFGGACFWGFARRDAGAGGEAETKTLGSEVHVR